MKKFKDDLLSNINELKSKVEQGEDFAAILMYSSNPDTKHRFLKALEILKGDNGSATG